MTEFKDVLYYGFLSYLGIGITYAALRDSYNFVKNKVNERKARKMQNAQSVFSQEYLDKNRCMYYNPDKAKMSQHCLEKRCTGGIAEKPRYCYTIKK